MDLNKAMEISASGMQAQGTRVKIIAENIANADSLGDKPGADPYRRKIVTFGNLLDRALGIEKVAVKRVTTDPGEFGKRYDPQHPAADAQGYVKTSNVNALMEMMDMRQAQRSYEANLNLITMSKTMIQRTIDILR
ncbi:MAG: flagellar basal body rod protein FlgC [Alphaproteobacteria bacterium]